MFKIKTASRLALFVAMIVGGTIWLAMSLHIAPNPTESKIQSRLREAHAIACSGATFAESGRLANFAELVETICQQNPDLLSIGLARSTGRYRFEAGEHSLHWIDKPGQPDQISVEIQANQQDWGTLQLKYIPVTGTGSWIGWLAGYPANFILFVSCSTCLFAWLMFSRVFHYLDPSRVVPGRVRSALDTLAEGLVLLDPAENIVHVNEAFGRMLGVRPGDLIGKRLDQWQWKMTDEPSSEDFPWTVGLKNRQELSGKLLQVELGGDLRQYLVNSNPIMADQGKSCRGVLISFDDVTQLERKKQDLADSFQSLRISRDEIRRQNHQLKFLASRDPLTQCYNRRSFWELFESNWTSTPAAMLNVLMVDLDHFKAINDHHGHSMGDTVLRETGAMLTHLIGERGLVCRYGGEEFAVLLPGIDLEGATEVANAVHSAFEDCEFGGLRVTASIGLSNRTFGAMDAQHLLDQADQCLYAAKRNGRNQVVRFDHVKVVEQKAAEEHPDDGQSFQRIPYLTVAAIFNIVVQRDSGSAAYCQELADLCVEAGKSVLSRQQLYWLEVAALLHRTGTIVSSPDTRNPNGEMEHPGTGPLFRRSTSASVFLTGILGDCEPARVLSLVESGEEGHILPDGSAAGQKSICQCATVFELCAEFLRWTRLGVEPTVICDELRRQHGDMFHERIIRAMETRTIVPQQGHSDTDSAQPGLVTSIARNHGNLNIAVIERNVARLVMAVDDIRSAIPDADLAILEPELVVLEKGAKDCDPDFEKLGSIIDQLIGICRLSRIQLISRVSIEESDEEYRRSLEASGQTETALSLHVNRLLPDYQTPQEPAS